MAVVTEAVDPDELVPSCPDWSVRQLVRHTGWVHRWAASIVGGRLPAPPTDRREIIPAGWPPDRDLAGWFREGHQRLVTVLGDAPPDLRCWTIMDAPHPRNFWARRQAHETAIHRLDTELAAGTPTGFEMVHAADGIDELLVWFINRPGRNPTAPHDMTLGVHATDVGRSWTATFGPETARGRRGRGKADCWVSGPAALLYPYLWSRTPLAELEVEDDRSVLAQWRESSSF